MPKESKRGSWGADRSGDLSLWTPPTLDSTPAMGALGSPREAPTGWKHCQPASSPRKHLLALAAHSNHMGNFKKKTPRLTTHSKHMYQKPEEVTSPSVESSKNRNKPVSRQKHTGAEGRCWSRSSCL